MTFIRFITHIQLYAITSKRQRSVPHFMSLITYSFLKHKAYTCSIYIHIRIICLANVHFFCHSSIFRPLISAVYLDDSFVMVFCNTYCYWSITDFTNVVNWNRLNIRARTLITRICILYVIHVQCV